MAIRNLSPEYLKVNVTMKDGRTYHGCDITSNPHAVPDFFAFWHDKVVRMVPVKDITYIDWYSQEQT